MLKQFLIDMKVNEEMNREVNDAMVAKAQAAGVGFVAPTMKVLAGAVLTTTDANAAMIVNIFSLFASLVLR